LVLEAGNADTYYPKVAAPAAMTELWNTEGDWSFWTEPQHHLAGRKLFWPRGKMLGGSSSINAMIYTRCPPSDYDAMDKLSGGHGVWNYTSLLPYFKRSETLNPFPAYALDVRELAEHGTDGPWNIEHTSFQSPITSKIMRACVETGIERVSDINNSVRGTMGVTRFQTFTKDGVRQNSRAAWLPEVAGGWFTSQPQRPNLVVGVGCRVLKIEFDEGPRARGVLFHCAKDGHTYRVHATKEIILAAGAVQSPHILLLSGIGPQEHLREHGIPLVKHLPGVGLHLSDHLQVPLVFLSAPGTSINHMDQYPYKLFELVKYLRGHKDAALRTIIAESGAFIRVPSGATSQGDTATSPNAPHIELIFMTAIYSQHGLAPRALTDGFTMAVTLLNPVSKGRVFLTSANPFHNPGIDPNYLDHNQDLEVLVDGMEAALAIAERLRLMGMLADNSSVVKNLWDYQGKNVGRDGLAQHVRLKSETMYHPTSTCKMGQPSDPLAVVDHTCKVIGIQGLRVVDVSVMPTVPAAHTCAPAVVIAERTAEFILQDYYATRQCKL
jgi:choline dehydrogenase